MNALPRSISPSRLLVITVVASIAMAYVIAPVLPVSFGWENHLIENLQFTVLLIGGVMALVHYTHTPIDERRKMLWLVVAPVWIVMAARELSWGAVFLSPLGMYAETGPVFSSSQLSYRPLVKPIIFVVLAVCVFIFVKPKQVHSLSTLWRQAGFPIRELFIFAACMMMAAAAEDHGLIDFSHLGAGAAQVFEEVVELSAYAALLCAQARVASSLKCEGQVNVARQKYLNVC